MTATATTEHVITSQMIADYRAASDPAVKLQLRDELIERHIPLMRVVIAGTFRVARGSPIVDEWLGVASIAVIEAIDRFKVELGHKFTTYAPRIIRGRLLDRQRVENEHSRLDIAKLRSHQAVELQLAHTLGRTATTEEVEQAGGGHVAPSVSSLEAIQARIAFDHDRKPFEPGVLADSRWDPQAEETASDWWETVLRGLNYHERFILKGYYRQGLTMKLIGEMLNLCESRVSQVHTELMNRLRETLPQRMPRELEGWAPAPAPPRPIDPPPAAAPRAESRPRPVVVSKPATPEPPRVLPIETPPAKPLRPKEPRPKAPVCNVGFRLPTAVREAADLAAKHNHQSTNAWVARQLAIAAAVDLSEVVAAGYGNSEQERQLAAACDAFVEEAPLGRIQRRLKHGA